ncbi:hypothetical protein M1112_00310 [Candidatus Parvarchaeota archaeon]|nr:hypothetical protein [Candidatus Parvarchaeota archaeon]
MFTKNAKKYLDGVTAVRTGLESVLLDISNSSVQDLLEFSYSDLSGYFKEAKYDSLRKKMDQGRFPPKSSDYVIRKGRPADNKMQDSSQLFYLKGVYKSRSAAEAEYFGVRKRDNQDHGKITITPVACIKYSPSNEYKVYLDYDKIKDIDKNTLRKIVIATGLKLADYKA